jgi:2-oxoglutarate ferredoxin oxidoreductase subunit alpha
LKSEALGLAITTELPLVLVNVQRGGPSTGLPTKTEQSDLNQAMFGRNGEAPMVVLAPATPTDCYNMAYESCRIALKYMTPVILLSDGYIANGSEPWKIPDVDSLPEIETHITTKKNGFAPFNHDNQNLARPWGLPGTPGLEHRVGGLEKWDETGHVSYDPDNHHKMVELRQQKVDIIANDIPKCKIYGKGQGDLLVVGWGGTHGAIRSAVESAQSEGLSISHLHLRHLNPLPKDLGEILVKFQKVMIPELNLGQLAMIIRSKFLVDVISLCKVQGKPLTQTEVYHKITELIKDMK